jgi:hypothetical protein
MFSKPIPIWNARRTQDVFPEAIGRLVTEAIRQFKNEIEKSVLISVDENRSRARLLPLG